MSELAPCSCPSKLWKVEIARKSLSKSGQMAPPSCGVPYVNRFQMEEMVDLRDTRRWMCEWMENAYRIVSQPSVLVPRAIGFRP